MRSRTSDPVWPRPRLLRDEMTARGRPFVTSAREAPRRSDDAVARARAASVVRDRRLIATEASQSGACATPPDRLSTPAAPFRGASFALASSRPDPSTDAEPPAERTMIMFPVVFESSRPGRLSFETTETADSSRARGRARDAYREPSRGSFGRPLGFSSFSPDARRGPDSAAGERSGDLQ